MNTSLALVQSLHRVQLFAVPWTAAHQASLSFTVSQKFSQTHVHWDSDAIQPSHPLSSPSPPGLNLSQNQGLFFFFFSSGSSLMSRLFMSGGQSSGVSASASVLPMNIQNWFPLGLTGWIFLQSKGLSRVFSNATVQKHQFFCAQPFFNFYF